MSLFPNIVRMTAVVMTDRVVAVVYPASMMRIMSPVAGTLIVGDVATGMKTGVAMPRIDHH